MLRIDEPLGLAPDEEIAGEIAQDPAFGGAPTGPVAATVGERASVRVAADTARGRIEFDFVTIGDARFAVQVAMGEGDEESWAAALAIRDSIIFDEDAIPPLVHTTPIFTTFERSDGTESRIVLYVPADWVVFDGSAGLLGDPSGDIEARVVSEPLDDRTLEEVAATFTDRAFDDTADLDGFDAATIARTDTDADGSVDEVVVIATAADVVLTFEVRDTTVHPDPALLDAIVDTLVAVG